MFLSRILMFLLILISTGFSDEIWNPEWNIYNMDFPSNPFPEHALIGYGDWCVPDEGPHPGIDFEDPSAGTALVLSPGNDTTYFRGAYFGGGGWELCIGNTIDADSGWGLGHLDIPPYEWPFRFGDSIFIPKQELCTTYGINWRHVHLSWIEELTQGPQGLEFEGIVNPFNYLIAPVGYDSIAWRPVYHFEDLLTHSQRGIIFDMNDILDTMQFLPGGIIWKLKKLQDEISDYIDIIVSPYSANKYWHYLAPNSGCRSISFEILRQDPFTGVWSNTLYGNRTLVSNDGIIPWGNTHEYNQLFLDIDLHGQIEPWRGHNAYILTNSGCDYGSVGYDNIWGNTSIESIHDWDTGKFNRGCWDTRMRYPDGNWSGYPRAFVNEHAAFPDGIYAVNVSANPHGNHGNFNEILLPKENVIDPASPTIGVFLNNFVPHIDNIEITNATGMCFEGSYDTPDTLTGDIYHVDQERTFTDYWVETDANLCLTATVCYSENVINDDIFVLGLTKGDQDTLWVCDDFEPIDLDISPSEYDANRNSFSRIYSSSIPVPDYYIGKLVCQIEANEQSSSNFSLDSDPVTIASVVRFAGPPASNYETDPMEFTWNLARYCYEDWSPPGGEGIIYGLTQLINPTCLYEIDVVELLPEIVYSWYTIPACTSGDCGWWPDRHGWCEYYTGVWLAPRPSWDQKDVYLIYLDPDTQFGWNSFTFEIPFMFPPQDEESPGELYPLYPYSNVVCSKCTYSDGNYLFIWWDDFATCSTGVGHVSCISAETHQMKDIRYPGQFAWHYNPGGGFYPPAGDTTWVNLHDAGTDLLYGTSNNTDCKNELVYLTVSDFFPGEDYLYDNISVLNNNLIEIFNETTDDLIQLRITLENPMSGGYRAFNLHSCENKPYTIKLIDLSGRIIWSVEGISTCEITSFNMPIALSPGLYFILANDSSTEICRKICIVK